MSDSGRLRWLSLHRDAAESIKDDLELRDRIGTIEEHMEKLGERIAKIEEVIANVGTNLSPAVMDTYCDDLADHDEQVGRFEDLLDQLKTDLESLQTRIASKLELAQELKDREQQDQDAERFSAGVAADAETQFVNRNGGSS